MYHILGINFSFNTTKVIYVAEESGIDYTYTNLDISSGENKTPEHLKRHPLGKLPTLDHDGQYLFESGAICRYLASVEDSTLYPVNNHYQRCLNDQWIDFFSIHLGRWLGTLCFERVFRESFGMGKPKEDLIEESLGFIKEQMEMINQHLAKNICLTGNNLSIADLFAFAYVETTEQSQFSLEPYPYVKNWFSQIQGRDSIRKAHQRLA